MYKFDEAAKVRSVNGALALRPQIQAAVEALCKKGFKNICWLGIGGTLASAMQVVVHMKERTSLEVFAQSAAEYLATGNRRVGKGTILIFSSVTGVTQEIVAGVEKAKADGATVIGFVDKADSPLARLSDYLISYPENEQLKFFMAADCFMWLAGEFEEYDAYYAEMDKHLAQALADVEKQADAFAEDYAQKHHNDELHYFVGAGNQWGATYSYAMCYWEEQHWLKTKSVHAAEFFHGTFEIIERDIPVTVYISEDSQRALGERVAKFLPRICGNYTIIDCKDYVLEGISPENRGSISHLVMHAVNNRIDVHLEHINRHPMDIRRYYRRLDY